MTDDELDALDEKLRKRRRAREKARKLQLQAVERLLKDAKLDGLTIVDLGMDKHNTAYGLRGWRDFMVGVRVTVPPGHYKTYRHKEGELSKMAQDVHTPRIDLDGSGWWWPYAVDRLQDDFVTNDEEEGP